MTIMFEDEQRTAIAELKRLKLELRQQYERDVAELNRKIDNLKNATVKIRAA